MSADLFDAVELRRRPWVNAAVGAVADQLRGYVPAGELDRLAFNIVAAVHACSTVGGRP